jgi:hypothetical protein
MVGRRPLHDGGRLAERRRGLQRISLNVSWANILVSVAVAAIALAV